MSKIFQLLTFLLVALSSFGQKIYYSNNISYAPQYEYNIVGSLKNHIILWKNNTVNKSKSRIYIYDNSMNLIRVVKTNILKSEADPQCNFFLNRNSFQVAYQYKHANDFLYLLSSFDENGNITETRTLDSININDTALRNKTTFYKILQSQNDNYICFIKMTDDLKYHVLKYDCTFINSNKIEKKNFVIAFDEKSETLMDVAIDKDKNFLFLKSTKKDSFISLELIKVNFKGEEMLTTNHAVKTTGFTANSVHIAVKPDGYLIFGNTQHYIKTDTTNILKPGLYIWQTDLFLNDFSTDTIIPEQYYKNIETLTAKIETKNKFSNVFATWGVKYSKTSLTTPSKASLNNYFNSEDKTDYTSFVLPSQHPAQGYKLPSGVSVPRDYLEYPAVNNNSFTSPVSTTKATLETDTVLYAVKNAVELFELGENNKMIWINIFNDSSDNKVLSNYKNAKIITGQDAIHLIYQSIADNNKISVYNIVVHANGNFERKFFGDWNMKYNYFLDKCFLTTGNDLIIPAVSGSRIKFAKLNLK